MALGVYAFSLVDVSGVAAANNFVSFFNPVGSGIVASMVRYKLSSYSVAVNVSKVSLRCTRITAASVGTLQAASAICKYRTSYANPLVEVRTANPTVTAGAEHCANPPPVLITAAGIGTTYTFEWTNYSNVDYALNLAAGEGIVFRQTGVGDVDETFDIFVEWMEV